MVPDPQTAYELEKYYFVPRETIVVESKAKNNESA